MMNLIMAVNETIWVDVLEKKKKKRDFAICYFMFYLQSGHIESQKDSHETLR